MVVKLKNGTVVAPTEDHLLVCPEKSKQAKTADGRGGMPTSGYTPPALVYGKCEACGPGRMDDNSGKRFPMHVKPGDRVAYPSHAPTPIDVDGETYHMVRESDVKATTSKE